MSTRYFVDGEGRYLGGWDGFTEEQLAELVPPGAISVEEPPASAAQRWNGSGYDAAPEPPMTLEEKVDMLLVTVDQLVQAQDVPAEARAELGDAAVT